MKSQVYKNSFPRPEWLYFLSRLFRFINSQAFHISNNFRAGRMFTDSIEDFYRASDSAAQQNYKITNWMENTTY